LRIVVLAFSAVILAPVSAAGQGDPLRVRLSVGVGVASEFTDEHLEDAATALLADRAPEWRVDETAPLLLRIGTECSPAGAGWKACSFSLHLVVIPEYWQQPVGFPPMLSLWVSSGVATTEGDALSSLRFFLGQRLDALVAGWRRLPEEQRACWTRFLNSPNDLESWASFSSGGDLPAAALAWGGLTFGPCQPGQVTSQALPR
jgi:hypothetical protein